MTDPVQGELAPYALVRLAALPRSDNAASPFRRACETLASVESSLLVLAGPVADLLHDSEGTHSDEYHRRVVLPLRDDVHNGRMPDPAALAAVGSLASRFPQLGEWLSLMSTRASLISEIECAQPAAMAAERPEVVGRAAVGWGTWSPDAPAADWGSPVAVTRVNQLLLTRLITALLADRARLFDHPHRLAPDVHSHNGSLRFRRDVPAGAEETVQVAASPPLQFLVGLTAANPKGISPAELTTALEARLPDGEAERAQQHVALFLAIKLLVPVWPVDPQDPAAPLALASWLRDRDQPELADLVTSLYRDTVAFGALPTADRPAALAALTSAWLELGSLVGFVADDVPVSEDVVLPQPVRLAHGYSSMRSLADLTPLLMLFDHQLAARRFARDRFVVEFGHGGVARPAACAPLLQAAQTDALTGLGAIRAQVADLVSEGIIIDEAVSAAADLLPAWMKTRPVSYSFFAQPLTGGLVVNHIRDGFGRFPSRFLDLLPPEAYATVRATLDGIFPKGFLEHRPVPNLHPLLGRAEVGEDPRWADHTPDAFEVFHDPDRDELRLRRRDTGAVVDVLCLAPASLSGRTAALHADLACGRPDLTPLQSTVERDSVQMRDRLRYRDVVLLRRSWEFSSLSISSAASVAALRARYDLPADVFVGSTYVDLTNARHLQGLPDLLRNGRVQLTEALPVPSGEVLELIAETYRRAVR